jgi:hypothetical protein
MALKIDTLQSSVGVAALRDAGCGVVGPVRVVLGSPFRMTLPAGRRSTGDWARESGA